MHHNDALQLFTARLERGEISLEAYRAETGTLTVHITPRILAAGLLKIGARK